MLFFDYLGLCVNYLKHALSRVDTTRPPVGHPREEIQWSNEHCKINSEIEKRADGHLAVCNHESAESQHNHGEHGEQYGEYRKESRFGIVELQISFIEIAADRIEAAEFFIFF